MASLYEQNILDRMNTCSIKDKYFYEGMCYFNGINCAKSKELGLQCYITGSEMGSVKCKYGIAVCKLKNAGEEALNYFIEAFPGLLSEADNKDDFSQRMVSCYYYFGNRGIEKNMAQAIFWLEQAVSLGNIEAIFDLAMCYEHGDGLEMNLQKAISLYQEAEKAGYHKATYALNKLNVNR